MLGIFLDTEANGLNYEKHLPIEIAIEVINLLDGSLLETYQSLIYISPNDFERSDPESLSFTGITYDELKEGKDFEVIKNDLLNIFKKHNLIRRKSIFICQNPSFDRMFFSKIIDADLQEEKNLPYNWLDLASMHWARCVRENRPINKIQLSKDEIANYFNIPPEEKPHRAANGVRHLVECYKKVVGFKKESTV